MRATIVAVLATVLTGFGIDAGAAGAAQRPFTIEDIFDLEPLTPYVAISPDEKLIAFMRKRPMRSEPDRHYIWTNDRSDVWIYDREKNEARNLTQGHAARADFWYPVWSPDGRKLAMISTRHHPGSSSHVWIWDRESGALSQLSDHHVDIENGSEIGHRLRYALFWMSESTLVFPTIPEGVRPIETVPTRQAMGEVIELWERKVKGVEPSSVIYESGLPLSREALTHKEKYTTCHVMTRQCRDQVESWMYRAGSQQAELLTVTPSPGGELMAVAGLRASWPIDPTQIGQTSDPVQYELRLFDAERERAREALEALAQVIPGSVRWSPDGERLAFIGAREWSPKAMPRDVFVLNITTGELTQVASPGLDPGFERLSRGGISRRLGLVWSAGNRLVLRAWKDGKDGWWLLDGSANPANVAADAGFVPQYLYPVRDGTSFLAIGRENLWELSIDGSARQLTAHAPDRDLLVLWTDADVERGARIRSLVYQLSKGREQGWHHFDVASGRSQKFEVPGDDLQFNAFAPASRFALLTQNDRTGTRLWLATAGKSAPKAIVETNTFLQNIAAGEVREIFYNSLEGESSRAWLILPVGYQKGRRYPMVAWVYPTPQTEWPHVLSSIATLNPLNLQTLAGKGYAVIIPSMGGSARRLNRLLNGLLPAVDKIIDMGIADPDRLAVMGQSLGGYATYGIVTLTDRFKAATALAGMTDWASLSLQFNPSLPATPFYRNASGVTTGRLGGMERMGFGLPWRSNAYLINSPITYVERVQTPVLMLHGDFDGATIQQAEEFYVALHRLGKRSRLVKYFGDDHLLQSPANIVDSWRQTIAWFDEHCDISRDAQGQLIFDGDRVKSRKRP
jgi:dipeptidyl aminopeptidase/acylaminoacyl peptidase